MKFRELIGVKRLFGPGSLIESGTPVMFGYLPKNIKQLLKWQPGHVTSVEEQIGKPAGWRAKTIMK